MSGFWKPGSEKPSLVDDEEGGVLFFSPPSSSSSSRFGYSGIEKQRQRLPVYKYRTAILYLVETHATTIVVGETGSGKTTQIPQYLKEAGWAEGGRVIACTQPRRLAVQAVATRVAEEMGVKLGEEVGFIIRFEDLTKPGVTKIKFLTDGVLLREMMDDPLLTNYSVIMVDEAHERSLSTDILLGLLKKVQRRRPDLRLIISSATIEAKTMSSFFNTRRPHRKAGEELEPSKEPAILSVEGRGYTVEIHYLEEPASDYLQAAVSTVLLIHDQEPMGDILVFLTGQDDIDAAVQQLSEEAHKHKKNSSGLVVLPLYSGLSRADQDLIFSPTPKGKRKVIVSTNIAETSLTLEGIVYVVDSGFSKQRYYNPISDIENLVVAPISKASARQRAGRAGRVRSGKCYRLYTEEYFVKEMPAEGIPEMQRSNLVSCVIQLKALGIDNVLGFDWPASPAPEAMVRALEVLYSLGILDDDAKLTSPIGFQVAEIPLDPMVSKMILSGNLLGCSEEVITIAAILSVQSIWVSVRGVQKEMDEAKLRFAAAEGDHVTYLNVYKRFLQSGKSSQWCYKNFINYHAMKKVIETREQLKRIAHRLGIALKSCERDTQVMLLGHSDSYVRDKIMQVTIAYNHFGEGLIQRMPRCRHGYFHVVNNDYTHWEMYAIGGSANPTINSQGNRYLASSNPFTKESVDTNDKNWKNWNWRSEGDLLLNWAFFTRSGAGGSSCYSKASSLSAKSSSMVPDSWSNSRRPKMINKASSSGLTEFLFSTDAATGCSGSAGTHGLQIFSLPKSIRAIPLAFKSSLVWSLLAYSLFFLACTLSSISDATFSSVKAALFNALSFNCCSTSE